MTAHGGVSEGAGKTALVIEDERFMRMLMVDALEECGYTVLEAADGPRGLQIMQSAARIDILVSDHMLPGGMTGYELAQRARRMRPAPLILLVTGVPEDIARGIRQSPDQFRLLAKPFTMVKLVLTVSEIVSAAKVRAKTHIDQ